MRRLIEEPLNPDSPDYALVALVRATPTLERAPFAAERILARVTSAKARRGRLPWAAAAVAVGIGVSAVAAAAVGHWGGYGRPPAPAAPASNSPVQASVAISELAGPTAETLSDRAVVRAVQSPPTPKHAPAMESRSAAGGEDPAPLLEAIRTLRSGHDPVRAGALLAEYLKAYPHSPLSEDALALSVEAAIARRDVRSGGDLARSYLTQFPKGRYRTFATMAAQSNPPTDNP